MLSRLTPLLLFPLLLSSLLLLLTAPAHACQLPKSYYKHVSCTSSSSYFLAVKDSGAPVALLNKSGKPAVDLSRYQRVASDKIAGGLMPVQRGGKVGYVNMRGREVIPAVYDVLLNESGSGGWARAVHDGRIVVKKDGKFGVITTANKVVVPFSASYVHIADYRSGEAQATRAGQAAIWLDKSGNQVANNGRSSMDTGSLILTPHQQDGKWGFVDQRDVTMITYSFDAVMPFSEGLAGVRIADHWGFIDQGGNLVIGFRFDEAGVMRDSLYLGKPAFTFADGKAWIGNLNNGDKMCINTDGTNVSCAGVQSAPLKRVIIND